MKGKKARYIEEEGGVEEREIDMGEVDDSLVEGSNRFEDCQ